MSSMSLVSGLDASILFTSLPRLAAFFHVESSTAGWLNIVYLVVNLSLTLTLAKTGDSLGRKRVLLVGLGFYAAGLMWAALATSMGQLIGARAVQGIGAATVFALGTAIAVAVFPSAERGKAVGILSGAGSAGLIIGPIAGGLLLDLLGWRAVFYVRVPIILACLVAVWLVVEEQRQKERRFALDGLGATTLFFWLSAFLLYLSLGGRWGFTSMRGLPLAAGAAIFFVLFLFAELRSPEPTVQLGLFRIRLFAAGTASAIIIAIGTSATAFLVPFYLMKGLGLPASAVGGYMAVLAAPAILFAPLSGRLSDKVGSRGLSTLGVAVVCVSLFCLARLGEKPTPFAIGFASALAGTGIGIFHPPNSSALMGAVPKEMLGVASAIAMMARNIGTCICIALSGAMFDIYEAAHLARLVKAGAGGTAKALAAVSASHDTFMFLLPIATIGIVTSLIRGQKGKG
jgi:EmrB/QacA subfamily drug resistance transporter